MRRLLVSFLLLAATGSFVLHGASRAGHAASRPQPPASSLASPSSRPQPPAASQALSPSSPQPPASSLIASPLSIDSIMKGPAVLGTPPAALRWSPDSSMLFFSWQKPGEDKPATWSVRRDGTGLARLTDDESKKVIAGASGRLNLTGTRLLTVESGDLVVYDIPTGARRVLFRTAATESAARWARGGRAVTFVRDGQLFLRVLEGPPDGPQEIQLIDTAAPAATPQGSSPAAGRPMRPPVAAGGPPAPPAATAPQTDTKSAPTTSQAYLKEEEKTLLAFVRKQTEHSETDRGEGRGPGGQAGPQPDRITKFSPGPRQTVVDLQLSADERLVYAVVTERPESIARSQGVPQYVTESSYTDIGPGRPNVGEPQAQRLLAMVALESGTVTWADASALAGTVTPAKPGDKPAPRLLDWSMPECSDDGSRCVASVRTQDFHDRWFVVVDPATGKATSVDHLHDDAWIRDGSVATPRGAQMGGGGFGGGSSIAWLADNRRFVSAAEKQGYMHLYVTDLGVTPAATTALTRGEWEVSGARLSNDRTRVYFSSNAVHPGERHFYVVSVNGGTPTKLTSTTGGHDVTLSPDETTIADVFSYTSKPPELFMGAMATPATLTAVTSTPTKEWLAFKWVDPQIIKYKARDGAWVYARLYTPEMVGAKRDRRHPAVIFVHGAGYLQFATRSWSSSYYREHLFHHLLASRGYVVLCPDYRASAGYGRDWRTGIYSHMGGKDLTDVVDGANFLVATEKVHAKRIGVYGGSYGGFITLMAMFTTPDVFAAGAALRPVTDWAHYNHSYTAPILGLPHVDAANYRRSSPIYFADGLKGHLLICHGMVDSNVFFQDTVRLVQKLIELRKENWTVAPYPVENHGFTEETSWADEYKRILALFETHLRR